MRQINFLNKKSLHSSIRRDIKTTSPKIIWGVQRKISAEQYGLFNEAEEIEETVAPEENVVTTVASHARQKKPRVNIPDHLPGEDITYDLNESVKSALTMALNSKSLAVTISNS